MWRTSATVTSKASEPKASKPQTETIRNHAAFIWSVADLLRGDYKQSEYGKVILPLTVLRRLDCVLEPTKAAGARHARRSSQGKVENVEPVLAGGRGRAVLQHVARSTFAKLLDDPTHVADNLRAYIAGFSPGARDVLEKFDFDAQIDRLDRAEPALPGRRRSSPRSTSIPTPSRTSRWATSTRS